MGPIGRRTAVLARERKGGPFRSQKPPEVMFRANETRTGKSPGHFLLPSGTKGRKRTLWLGFPRFFCAFPSFNNGEGAAACLLSFGARLPLVPHPPSGARSSRAPMGRFGVAAHFFFFFLVLIRRWRFLAGNRRNTPRLLIP